MRNRIVVAVVTILAALGPMAVPVIAGPESNIPGIALPGPVATGQLGGPIVDVVYHVDVPAQRVLIVSLTGSPGTDFDIYLFDSTASNVYADPLVGLVAKSTGPTSTESVRYSTATGGRFYIDLSSSDVEGSYRLSVGIGLDTTPPRLSLALDGGAPATNDRTVSVSVNATDDLSGVANMQFSDDGSTWSGWQPWQPITQLVLPDRDGLRTLWARVSDNQGNISAPAQASIVLDRVPPSLVDRYPVPNGVVAGPRPTLWARFSEALRPSSWASFGLILQDAAGTVIYGTYGWDATTNTGSFTPSSDLLIGATYVVSFGSLVDLAGNALPPLGAWTMRPLPAPHITLTADPRATLPGGKVLIAGTTDPSFMGAYSLEQLGADGAWTQVEPLLPDPSGGFYSNRTISSNATFRVTYGGDDASAPATGPAVRILVRRSIGALGLTSSIVRFARPNAVIAVTAVAGPSTPPVLVTLTLYRYDATHRVYRVIARVSRTTIGGRASFAWRGSSAGSYAIRLTTPASADFAAGVSPLYRWVLR